MFIHTQFEKHDKSSSHIKTFYALVYSSCNSKAKKEYRIRRKTNNLFFPVIIVTRSVGHFKSCTHFKLLCKKARVTERVNVSFVSHVDVNSPFEVMDQGGKKRVTHLYLKMKLFIVFTTHNRTIEFINSLDRKISKLKKIDDYIFFTFYHSDPSLQTVN